MIFLYNPYIWIYLTATASLLISLIFAVFKKSKDYLWYTLQLMVMFWCVGFALQISSPDLKTARFWYLAANDFVGFKSPAVLLLWSLVFTGRKYRITRFRTVSLFILPLITDILNLTNSYHGLMYRRMWIDTSSGYPIFHFDSGYWYWIITIYCCILLFIVSAIVINDTLNRKLLYTNQGLTVAVVTVLVLLSIIIVLVDGSLFNYFDPTPLIISAIIVGSTFAFQCRNQETVPIPRNVVIDKMTSAVLILDNNNRIMDMNATAEAFLGLKAAMVSGRYIKDVLTGWDNLVKACLEKIDYSEFSRDQRYYMVYISRLSDERKSAGKIVIIQDATKYKEFESKTAKQEQALIALQERNRIARELHDSLGQVLGYINMQIEIIRKMLKSSNPQTIDATLVSLSNVIEEANIEVREFIYEVKTTLIFKNGFFSALMQYLQHFEQNFNIHIETKNPDNITDEQIGLPVGIQLFRIIQEVLANVRKHAKSDKVVITFKHEGDDIHISISDDGVGFNPEKINSNASFGLTVMRERASHIGGQVKIESAPSQGTTVTVIVPQSVTGVEPNPENQEIVSDTSKIKVLLADDHVLFMDGLRKLIEQHDFKVVGIARDGYEALEKARELKPDMILMDLQMPRCNGITATRLINMEMPEIKIVILSMSDREHDLFQAIKNGASGYLLKGLSTKDFIEQLNILASNKTVISREIASQVMEEFNHFENNTPPQADPKDCLTKRQLEILSLIAKGLTYKEVAASLYIGERTVKYEMSNILKQLHLQSRSEAISFAQNAGLVKK